MENQTKIKKRKPWLAALLNLLSAGTGQIYNGELKKGVSIYLFWWCSLFLFLYFQIFHSFKGMTIGLGILGLFTIVIVRDAFVSASKKKDYPLKAYNKVIVYCLPYFLSIFINLGLSAFFNFPYSSTLFGLESFNMPSSSMTPTLQPGDVFMTDLSYYKKHAPKKGDLVIFPYPVKPELVFVKRIVALEGDSVQIKAGDLYVNQQKIEDKSASPKLSSLADDTEVQVISPGKAFVVGDNLQNSSDSREWGLVDVNSFISKPLYIYFSKDTNRIGKSLQ